MSAEASLSDCAELCKERATLALSNVDLSELLRPFGVEALNGRASLKVEAAAEGQTPEAVVASAHAQANFKAENGAILGLDFEEALRRSQRHPLDIARDLATGQTPFSSANAELAIDGGRARIVAARLAGPGVNIESNGEIDLSGCAWGARFEAVASRRAGSADLRRGSPQSRTRRLVDASLALRRAVRALYATKCQGPIHAAALPKAPPLRRKTPRGRET